MAGLDLEHRVGNTVHNSLISAEFIKGSTIEKHFGYNF